MDWGGDYLSEVTKCQKEYWMSSFYVDVSCDVLNKQSTQSV